MSFRNLLLAAVAGVVWFSVLPPSSVAADINWVGYQFGPSGGFEINPFPEASFFHSDNWFGYDVPGVGDRAIFDLGFDPQENGMPSVIHFGDYTRPSIPIFAPEPFPIPGGDATLAHMDFKSGNFTLDLGGHTVELTGTSVPNFFYDALRIGYTGSGGLDPKSIVTVEGGGTLKANGLRFAPVGLAGFGGKGKLVVTGAGTTVDIGTGITMFGTDGDSGRPAGGEIVVENGASMIVRYLAANSYGIQAFEDSHILATGSGSTFTADTTTWIRDGAVLAANQGGTLDLLRGLYSDNAQTTITGSGSQLKTTWISMIDASDLSLAQGASLKARSVQLEDGVISLKSNSTAEVDTWTVLGLSSNTNAELQLAGSTYKTTSYMTVGGRGEGKVLLTSVAKLTANTIAVADEVGGRGLLSINGGSQVDAYRGLIIGDAEQSSGEVLIGGGSIINAIHPDTFANGTYNDNVRSGIIIGEDGRGKMTIEGGSQVTASLNWTANSIVIGNNFHSDEAYGELVVRGAGTVVNTVSGISMDSGEMRIENGGQVLLMQSPYGGSVGSPIGLDGTGSVTIAGQGSNWTTKNIGIGGAPNLSVDTPGQATITVSDHGELVDSGKTSIAYSKSSTGQLSVESSAIASLNALDVGVQGQGKLQIRSQAKLMVSGALRLGIENGARGEMAVLNSGIVNADTLTIGGKGVGVATIDEGGSITGLQETTIGDNGSLRIKGLADLGNVKQFKGALVYNRGEIVISDNSSIEVGWLRIFPTAILSAKGKSKIDGESIFHVLGGDALFENSSLDADTLEIVSGVFVAENNSRISSVRQVSVGWLAEPNSTSYAPSGDAELRLFGGSQLQSTDSGSPTRTSGIVGRGVGDVGKVTVQDAGSLWENQGYLTIGSAGTGSLDIKSGGAVRSAGGRLGRAVGSNGIATIHGANSVWDISEVLYIGGDENAAGGTGKLVVKEQGAAYIESELRVWQSGTVELDDTGIITVGNVGVNPTPGVLAVGLGGTLSGNGNIIGDVAIAGGTLSPGTSPGLLKFAGDLSLSASSILKLELAGTPAGLFDQLQVTGNLSILGTIQVSLLNGFQPQAGDTFKFFNVGGTLDLSQASFALPAGLSLTSIGPGEFQVGAVPEPATGTLLLVGLALFGRRVRRMPERRLCVMPST